MMERYSGGGDALPARSHARHRYQLATERQGCHFFARRSITSGFGKTAGVIGFDFGGRPKVSRNPLRTP